MTAQFNLPCFENVAIKWPVYYYEGVDRGYRLPSPTPVSPNSHPPFSHLPKLFSSHPLSLSSHHLVSQLSHLVSQPPLLSNNKKYTCPQQEYQFKNLCSLFWYCSQSFDKSFGQFVIFVLLLK